MWVVSLKHGSNQKDKKQDYRLGRKIQRIKKEKDLTQEKLAEKIGVSTTWIGYIETGYRKPNLKLVYKITRALNVKVKDIFPFLVEFLTKAWKRIITYILLNFGASRNIPPYLLMVKYGVCR